jgi:hypothetical protein
MCPARELSCVLDSSLPFSYWRGDVRGGFVAVRQGDAIHYNQ